MIRRLLFILTLLQTTLGTAQKSTIQLLHPVEFELLSNLQKNTEWIDVPKSQKEVFSFAIKTDSAVDVSFRTHSSTKKISKWKSVEVNAHRQATDIHWVSELYFIPNETDKIQFNHSVSDSLNQSLEIHFFEIPAGYASDKNIALDSTNCECEQPAYLNRTDWCPDNNCPEIINPFITEVTHLIVHHSATSNSSTNWPGVVRTIWDFHVNINGWDDIGYNWLVDPTGVIYQGRGDNVRGAHFCGANTGTMGVCMIGNFQLTAPQDSAVEKLTKLLAWKSCDVAIHPTDTAFHSSSGLQLNRIAGHRQGCSTACPGDLFFPSFPALRTAVDTYIIDSCETIMINNTLEKNDFDIHLYPNPAIDFIKLEMPSLENIKYTIVDNTGKVMVSEKKLTKSRIDISNIPPGIYFLNIKKENQSTVKKFSVLRAK